MGHLSTPPAERRCQHRFTEEQVTTRGWHPSWVGAQCGAYKQRGYEYCRPHNPDLEPLPIVRATVKYEPTRLPVRQRLHLTAQAIALQLDS